VAAHAEPVADPEVPTVRGRVAERADGGAALAALELAVGLAERPAAAGELALDDGRGELKPGGDLG
jgi:hypothetical protein